MSDSTAHEMLIECNARAAKHRALRDSALDCLQPFSPIIRLIATDGPEDVRPQVDPATFQSVVHALAMVTLHVMELQTLAADAAQLRRAAFDGSN